MLSEDSNQPVLPCSLISLLSARKQFASLAIQNASSEDLIRLCECWAHMSEGAFSDVATHLFIGIL